MLASAAAILTLGLLAPSAIPSMPPPGIERFHVDAPAVVVPTSISITGLSASGVLLADLASGQEIFSYAADEARPFGSLAKLMTALLLVERHQAQEIVTIPALAENIGGSTLGVIAGHRYRLVDLLHAMLLPSANDVAYALAAFDAGGVGSFVRRMNDRAVALGLRHTHFANPAGFDHAEQYASPRDLLWLTMATLRHPLLRQIVGTRTASISSLEGAMAQLRNTNELLQYNEDVFGVKTGTTDAAGECLIVLFSEGGREYLLVLLGSRDRYADSLRVLQALHDAVR